MAAADLVCVSIHVQQSKLERVWFALLASGGVSCPVFCQAHQYEYVEKTHRKPNDTFPIFNLSERTKQETKYALKSWRQDHK